MSLKTTRSNSPSRMRDTTVSLDRQVVEKPCQRESSPVESLSPFGWPLQYRWSMRGKSTASAPRSRRSPWKSPSPRKSSKSGLTTRTRGITCADSRGHPTRRACAQTGTAYQEARRSRTLSVHVQHFDHQKIRAMTVKVKPRRAANSCPSTSRTIKSGRPKPASSRSPDSVRPGTVTS